MADMLFDRRAQPIVVWNLEYAHVEPLAIPVKAGDME